MIIITSALLTENAVQMYVQQKVFFCMSYSVD
jgi:hypothetical protein